MKDITQDGWISVQYKLPDVDDKDTWNKENLISERVLCWVDGFGLSFGTCWLKNEHWSVSGISGDIKVTHWQPLPKPPIK